MADPWYRTITRRAMAGADRRQARLDARRDGLPALRDGHRAPEGIFPFRRRDRRAAGNHHAPDLRRGRPVLRRDRGPLRPRAHADVHDPDLLARVARRGDVADADAAAVVARAARPRHGRRVGVRRRARQRDPGPPSIAPRRSASCSPAGRSVTSSPPSPRPWCSTCCPSVSRPGAGCSSSARSPRCSRSGCAGACPSRRSG